MDINSIINVVAPAGVFGVCFVWLFIKYTNESNNRESRLLQALDKFAACFESLKSDIAEIKSDIDEMKGK